MHRKQCNHCHKEIPSTITVCPYCRRDEKGQELAADAAAPEAADSKLKDDLNQLGNEDPYVRRSAGDRIVQRGASAVPALSAMVSEHTHRGVPEAARLLGRLKDRRAIGCLAQALKIGNEDLRTTAVWALAQMNDPQALNELLQESERNNPAVQAYLAHIIGSVQDSRVVPALIKLAQHSSREVSFQAIWALGEAGNPAAIMPLRKLLGGKDDLLQSAAEASLRRLGGSVRRAFPLWAIITGLSVLLLGLWGVIQFFYK
jgi:HEAT repeat protein